MTGFDRDAVGCAGCNRSVTIRAETELTTTAEGLHLLPRPEKID